MAVPLSGGCCLVALCHASSRAEAVCFSKGNVAVRSWAGLQPGFISFTPRLAGPHGRMTKEGAAVRAPCRYTSTVAKMRISPRKEQSRGRSCPAACTSHASSVLRVFWCLHADGHDEGSKCRKDGANEGGENNNSGALTGILKSGGGPSVVVPAHHANPGFDARLS